ncbi:16S rRNA (guanine(966)-N(2))-methyltransferase RsmD [Pseudoalteromonas sp. OFAV1]|uniref:16S rRNA (guanine(966)-N(2))-methyltransferase RsmD n=1 Tax=Pseudoalteromonas sp. OFAV1 TaxID=2908892 RepID=UPI001F3F8511|nr:16S rRNA (guanine(966)-N(2))-methyltransferase RsmD [Pseudoalteromonas sp. OFAV1]MCF2901774.1 16S rRNA (guanine(966)-N(2))-methyltransferase RsmD [Pseudoalteromonas sp. OFAV1]
MIKKSTAKRPVKAANNKTANGFIRIISGQFRGRKLPVKDVQGLRPTTDRIKETVFNWLMQDTRDAAVLDCFAGSGGLGFEALSRFAASAVFFELDKSATAQLNSNIATLQLKNATVKHGDSLTLLNNNAENDKFDLVFVDPPFRQNLAEKSCFLLESNHWLTEQALIYVEVESELSNLDTPDNWLLLKEKTAGQVICRLYQRETN